jgi:hypothetical protein
MARRTHPVLTGGVRFKFEADLKIALDAVRHALKTTEEPMMDEFLAPYGRADVLIDIHEAEKRLTTVLADLDALPAKVEFEFKED